MSSFIQSASQLKLVKACVRQAGLKYIDKVRLAENHDSRELGKKIHAINQAYVRHGTEPDLTEIFWKRTLNPHTGLWASKPIFPGQVAAASFPLLRRGPLGVEQWYTETKIDGLTLPSGIPLRGDIDLAIAEFPQLEIRDYKTTSDFKYGLTEAELLTDIQTQLYGYAGFAAIDRQSIRVQDLSALTVHWQYLLTKGKPRSHSVRALITREHNAIQVDKIDQLAQGWVQIRRKGTPGAQLPPTGLATGECSKFCPYVGTKHCVITPEDAIRYSGGTNVDLASLLNAKVASQQTLTQVTPPAGLTGAPASNPFLAAPTRPSFWMPGDPLNDLQEYAKGKGKPDSFLATLADNPPPNEVAAGYDAKVESGTFNPPEAQGMIPAANPAAQALLQAPQGVATAPVAAETEGGDFAALKARAQALGILPEGKNLKTAGIKKLLAEYDAKGPATVQVPPGASMSQHLPAVVQAVTNPFAQTVNVTVPGNVDPAQITAEISAMSQPNAPQGQVSIHPDRLRHLERCERIVTGLEALVQAFKS